MSISGGKSILLSNAKKVTDPEAVSRIQKNFRSKIRVIDLKKESVTATDLMPVGFGRPSLPAWTELFVDGKPMNLSRWPNDTVNSSGKSIMKEIFRERIFIIKEMPSLVMMILVRQDGQRLLRCGLQVILPGAIQMIWFAWLLLIL